MARFRSTEMAVRLRMLPRHRRWSIACQKRTGNAWTGQGRGWYNWTPSHIGIVHEAMSRSEMLRLTIK